MFTLSFPKDWCNIMNSSRYVVAEVFITLPCFLEQNSEKKANWPSPTVFYVPENLSFRQVMILKVKTAACYVTSTVTIIVIVNVSCIVQPIVHFIVNHKIKNTVRSNTTSICGYKLINSDKTDGFRTRTW